MSLIANSRQVDGVTIVELSGRIVLGDKGAPIQDTLKDLVSCGQNRILLNFSNVSYIDSWGLGTLVNGYTSVIDQQGQLKLSNLTAKVRNVMQMTRLLTIFEVYDDEMTAVRSFR